MYSHPGTSKVDNYSASVPTHKTVHQLFYLQCKSKPQGSQVLYGLLIPMPQIKPDHFLNVCLYLSLVPLGTIFIRVKVVSPF